MATQEVVTLAELKAFMGVTDTSSDTALALFLASTVAQVTKYLGTYILDTTITDEAHTIDDKQRHVCLRHLPARTVTVKENDEALTEDTDYALDADNGILTRLYSFWYPGSKMVKVSYKAGWADGTIPADIKFAVMQQAAYYWRRRDEAGLTSRTVEGGITLNESYGLLKGVRDLLAPYRVGAK